MRYDRKVLSMFFFAWGMLGLTSGIEDGNILNISKAVVTFGVAGYMYFSVGIGRTD